MQLNFIKQVENLQSRNSNIILYQKELDKKNVRRKKEVTEFCKFKGIKNISLFINTLKFFDYSVARFTIVDVDLLYYVLKLTYFDKENYKLYESSDFSKKQLRELRKMSDYDRSVYDCSVPWKEMKIRSNYKELKLYDNAQIFVKVKEELMLDYIKYLGGRK